MPEIILNSNSLYETDPSEYSYFSLLNGSYFGQYYPYGAGWLGREVGQRESTFSTDYTSNIVPILVPRDDLLPTEASITRKLNERSLGFYDLPSWLLGSARVFSSNEFPDTSLWHAISDLFNIADPTALVLSAKFSKDSFGGMDTGPATASPRQAYWLEGVNVLSNYLGNLTNREVDIRPAASYWDFSTAFDPVYILLEDNSGILIRNIDKRTQINIEIQNPLEDGTYAIPLSLITQQVSGLCEDADAAFVWSGSDSLSDTKYIPPAQALSANALKLDLSSGLSNLFDIPTFTVADFIFPKVYGPGFNIPRNSSLLQKTSEDNVPWTSSQYPLQISSQSASGITYGLFYTYSSGSQTIYDSSGNAIGQAHPVDLRNGWDRAGEFIGLVRQPGESNFRFAARQQRVLIAAINNQYSGSGNRVDKILSTIFGSSILTDIWDGSTSSLLPEGIIGIDTLTRNNETDTLYFNSGDIIPINYLSNVVSPIASGYQDIFQKGYMKTPSIQKYLTYASGTAINSSRVFKCREDLSCWENILITIDNKTLIPGRDYLISVEDPSIILLHNSIPIIKGVSTLPFKISLSNKSRVKISLSGDDIAALQYSTWDRQRSSRLVNSETLSSIYKTYVSNLEDPIFSGRLQIASSSGSVAYPPSGMSGDNYPTPYRSNILFSKGPKSSTLSTIENRRLYISGRSYPTQLGQSVFNNKSNSLWNTKRSKAINTGTIPTDLPNPPYIPV